MCDVRLHQTGQCLILLAGALQQCFAQWCKLPLVLGCVGKCWQAVYRMVQVSHHSPCIVSLSRFAGMLYVGFGATKLHLYAALPDAVRAGTEATGPSAARCEAQSQITGPAVLEGCLSRRPPWSAAIMLASACGWCLSQDGACLPALAGRVCPSGRRLLESGIFADSVC